MPGHRTDFKHKGDQSPAIAPKWWLRLHAQMTISYVWLTVATVLLLEGLLVTSILTLVFYTSFADDDLIAQARQTAKLYALSAAAQAGGARLDPHTTFMPDQPASIALAEPQTPENMNEVPYIAKSFSSNQPVAFALLIDPQGRVLASSDPQRFPASVSVEKLLPTKMDLIHHALAGRPDSRVDGIQQGREGAATETVWSREKQVIGVVYVQMPRVFPDTGGLLDFVGVWFKSGLVWLLVTVPIGTFFGSITTRGLVQRIQRLIAATTSFANGHYAQRVQITRHDEVGQLEQQFNRMAEQLVDSIAQRQTLAEQNARLEERARISRDLHDSVKQRVFALAMQVSAALSLLEHKREAVRQPLLEAEMLTYEVQQELTTLIQELRPTELQEKGIVQVLREYVTNWSRQHAIKADLHLPTTCTLSQPLAEALLRVTQEALSNIARHSHASFAQLYLTCDNEQIKLSIRDNGQGFDTTNIQCSGVGLHSMQERMQGLGGTITIESHTGQGTYLEACCPCPDA